MTRSTNPLSGFPLVFLVIGLPLLGVALTGGSLRKFGQFPPPLQIPTDYLPFSWLAVTAVLACMALLAIPWILQLRRPPAALLPPPTHLAKRHPFPIWGVIALIWMGSWWLLAWTRWHWFAPAQRYTFFPLWLGLIITVNAAVVHRTGSCLMLRAPARWLALFVASGACWWTFEWLNRFVENWHYLGVQGISAMEYAVHASVCFSTVLPAVAALAEWIASHPRWQALTVSGPKWRWLEGRGMAAVLFAGGILALLGTGVWPTWLYPALWVAPLALFLSAPILAGRPGLAREIARGDWGRAATWMSASLACGFLWDLWNWHSEAKWIYTVPGVERWHVFEMPLLGFAGYLPFGLECLLVAERVIGDAWWPEGTATATPVAPASDGGPA